MRAWTRRNSWPEHPKVHVLQPATMKPWKQYLQLAVDRVTLTKRRGFPKARNSHQGLSAFVEPVLLSVGRITYRCAADKVTAKGNREGASFKSLWRDSSDERVRARWWWGRERQRWRQQRWWWSSSVVVLVLLVVAIVMACHGRSRCRRLYMGV